MAPEIAAFAETSLDEIEPRIQAARAAFRSNKTKDIEFRIRQLRRLYWVIRDNTPLIREALARDLGKAPQEADLTEIDWTAAECLLHIKNLRKWAREESVPGVPLHFLIANIRLRSEPLGTVLVIAPFNFPFQLTLTSLIGAISAGNTVIVKPSELVPHSAMVLKKLIDDALDPECYSCVNGGLEVSKHLLEHKFDKIAFTGSKRTGTIIAKKAAETLTPVLLELGGQNPAFITRHANIKLAARRLLWNKSLAAGQLCVSQNYALVERSMVDPFIAALKESYDAFFPQGAQKSPDLARIVNAGSLDRLKRLLDGTKGKVVVGGATDRASLFMEPTIVLVENPLDDVLLEDETFGPLWSIVPFDSLDQAIDIANTIDPTPLGLYAFASDEENEWILKNVTSGGATLNDGFTHSTPNEIPFGGVGSSGQGAYRGHASFRNFSHQRAVAKVPTCVDALMRVRYMPYRPADLSRFRALTVDSPNFDRRGNIVKGFRYWLSFVLTLGANSAAGGAVRWALLFIVSAVLKLKAGMLGSQ